LHVAYACADRGIRVGGQSGAAVHVHELTRALVDNGVEVRTLAARVEGDGGASLVDLGTNRAIKNARRLLLNDVRGRRQERAAAMETYSLMINQALARELERLHRHWPIDAVYERYSLWSFAAANFAASAGLPYLLEINAPLRVEQRRYRTLANEAVAASLESFLFRAADYAIVPSAQLGPYVCQHGVARRNLQVVPNAADRALLEMRRPPRRSGDPFVIGFVGSLKPWHGVDLLVRAFRRLVRRHADYRLLIVGDGPMRGELEAMLRQYGLRRQTTFAQADRAQIPELLGQMDVGVAPYPLIRPFYFSPLKMFEYMAARVPVVASDIGQIGDVLRHGKSALLHRPGRITEMVDCIESVRQSPRLAARIATEARRIVQRRHTWHHNASRVEKMIRKALAGKRQLSAREGE